MSGLPLVAILSTLDGRDLRAWRTRLGLTQVELGLCLNIPQETISRWERETFRIEHPLLLVRAMRDLERQLGEPAE